MKGALKVPWGRLLLKLGQALATVRARRVALPQKEDTDPHAEGGLAPAGGTADRAWRQSCVSVVVFILARKQLKMSLQV